MSTSEQKTAGGQLDTAQLEFDRIDGELDAAIVFAVAASQNGPGQSAALSDARECYKHVLSALPKADLSGGQLEQLKAKLIRLRQLLGDATPASDAAA